MTIEQLILGVKDAHGLDMSDDAAITLVRHAIAKLVSLEIEPVGYFFQNEETGQMMSVDVQQVEWGFEKNNPRLINCGKLYAEHQVLAIKLKDVMQSQVGNWIPWNGGDCPVGRDVVVETKCRGDTEQDLPGRGLASFWWWQHSPDHSDPSDIVEYRVAKN